MLDKTSDLIKTRKIWFLYEPVDRFIHLKKSADRLK